MPAYLTASFLLRLRRSVLQNPRRKEYPHHKKLELKDKNQKGGRKAFFLLPFDFVECFRICHMLFFHNASKVSDFYGINSLYILTKETIMDQTLLERVNPVFNTAKMTVYQLAATGNADAVEIA